MSVVIPVLRTLSEVLTAAVAMAAFSVLLFSLQFVRRRQKLAIALVPVLLSVTVIYSADALETMADGHAGKMLWQMIHWTGFVLLPAVCFWFSLVLLELTGRKASLIPDPTLCLDRRDWEQLSEPPAEALPENYILLFFLGDINNETKKSIIDAALQMNLRIVDIGKFTTNKYFSINAGHFLWMIQHASFICTDSFHATVFSIIFQRDFYAFRRNGMSLMFDRIETLLERFDMKDRIIKEHAFFISQIKKEASGMIVGTHAA